MTGTLKIETVKDPVTGEFRVPKEVMRLLLDFARHRDLCDECGPAWRNKTGRYCATGQSLVDELLSQPEVKFI